MKRVVNRQVTLNLPPAHPAQHRFITMFDNNPQLRYLVGACASKFGKTFGCSLAIIRNAWNNEATTNWWVAPTYGHCEIAFDLIQSFLPEGLYKAYKGDLKIEILNPNGKARSRIDFKSAEKESSLRGFAVNYFIIDEAARVSEDAWLSVQTTTTQTRGKGILISTPLGRNWFYDLYQKGEKFWPDGTAKYNEFNQDPYSAFYSIRLPAYENPTVSAEEIEFKRLTLSHDDFIQEIEAQFLSESAGVFRGIDLCTRGSQLPPVAGRRYQLGVDLARKKDSTVLTVIDCLTKHVVFFDRFNKIEWTAQKHRIEQVAKFYNNAKVVVDSTGVGDPIAEALTKAGLDVEPYTISSNTKKKHLIDNLRLLIEQGKISFPNIKDLVDELRVFEYTFSNSSSAIKFSAPSGKHDDCVISLALACLNLDAAPKQYTLSNVRGI